MCLTHGAVVLVNEVGLHPRGQTVESHPNPRRVPRLSHQLPPLRPVRPAASAEKLVHGNVRRFVTNNLLEQREWLVDESRVDANQFRRRPRPPKSDPQTRRPLHAKPLLQARNSPLERPPFDSLAEAVGQFIEINVVHEECTDRGFGREFQAEAACPPVSPRPDGRGPG